MYGNELEQLARSRSERGARDYKSNPAEENQDEQQIAEENYFPEVRRVSARNL